MGALVSSICVMGVVRDRRGRGRGMSSHDRERDVEHKVIQNTSTLPKLTKP